MSPVFVKTQHSHRNYKKFVGNCLHTTVQAKKLCSPQRAAQKPTKHVLFAESTVTEMAHIHVLQNLPIAQVTMTQRLTQFRQYGAPPCFLRNIHNSRNDHYPWERDRPWRPCSMASEITRPLDFTCWTISCACMPHSVRNLTRHISQAMLWAHQEMPSRVKAELGVTLYGSAHWPTYPPCLITWGYSLQHFLPFIIFKVQPDRWSNKFVTEVCNNPVHENTDEPGYNDTSSIASDILCCQLIPHC